MAFIYTDRAGTKRCKGCGRNAEKTIRKGEILCDNCLRLESAKAKGKRKK